MIDDDARRQCAQSDFNQALGNRNSVLDTVDQIVNDQEAFGHVRTDRSHKGELHWKAQLIEQLDGSELTRANPLFYYHTDNVRDKLEGMRKDANEGKIHALVGSILCAQIPLWQVELTDIYTQVDWRGEINPEWEPTQIVRGLPVSSKFAHVAQRASHQSTAGSIRYTLEDVKSDLRLIESKVFTSKRSRFRNQWSATILGEIKRREDFSVSRFECWYTIKPILDLMLTKVSRSSTVRVQTPRLSNLQQINSIKAEVREGNLSQKKTKEAFLAEFDPTKVLRLIGLESVSRPFFLRDDVDSTLNRVPSLGPGRALPRSSSIE